MTVNLEQEIKASLKDATHLSCPAAWSIAKKTGVAKKKVGEAADEMKVRITDCQLGCFGVRKATHEELAGKAPPEALAVEISAALDSDGTLQCETAFRLAAKVKVAPREVGDATTLMKIHVSQCQLGCF